VPGIARRCARNKTNWSDLSGKPPIPLFSQQGCCDVSGFRSVDQPRLRQAAIQRVHGGDWRAILHFFEKSVEGPSTMRGGDPEALLEGRLLRNIPPRGAWLPTTSEESKR